MTLVLGGAGALIGSSFGGPAGARLGWAIGTTIGGVIDAINNRPNPGPQGKLSDLRVQTAAYGSTIPRAWGRNVIPGNIIWAANYLNNKTLVPTNSTDYVLTVTANAAIGATTISVAAIPYAIPNKSTIQFLSGWEAQLSSSAAVGATTLHVTALTHAISSGD